MAGPETLTKAAMPSRRGSGMVKCAHGHLSSHPPPPPALPGLCLCLCLCSCRSQRTRRWPVALAQSHLPDSARVVPAMVAGPMPVPNARSSNARAIAPSDCSAPSRPSRRVGGCRSLRRRDETSQGDAVVEWMISGRVWCRSRGLVVKSESRRLSLPHARDGVSSERPASEQATQTSHRGRASAPGLRKAEARRHPIIALAGDRWSQI